MNINVHIYRRGHWISERRRFQGHIENEGQTWYLTEVQVFDTDKPDSLGLASHAPHRQRQPRSHLHAWERERK